LTKKNSSIRLTPGPRGGRRRRRSRESSTWWPG